jgi:hypothetical protein
LFYGIQKFFEEIEKKLSADTKLEIAVWLLDLHPGKAIQSWHSTFPKVFTSAFGDRHFSWKCFWRSSFASVCTSAVVFTAAFLLKDFPFSSAFEAYFTFLGASIPIW